MIARGLKRLATLFLALAAVTAAVSLVIGLFTGTPTLRALSLGFMLVGSFVFVLGGAIGLRGPTRRAHRPDGSVAGVTVDSPGDRIESINASYVLLAIGIGLVLLGVVLDPNARLV